MKNHKNNIFACEYKETVEREYPQKETGYTWFDYSSSWWRKNSLLNPIKKLTQMAPLIELDNRYLKFCSKKSSHRDLRSTSPLKSNF